MTTTATDLVDVTAVLVAHEGVAWLPTALAALRSQTVVARHIVLVDTGSTDGSADLLRSAGLSSYEVVVLPAGSGYGAAVAAGLAAVPASSWVWLLHDDCAPDPDALERLLEHSRRSPSATLLGPKVRDWADPRLLVEVGLTTDDGGHRETGLDRPEYDQGQHDAVREVLAVGTAGALVSRQAWDHLGGLDPALPLFADDLDLGWRINAAGGRVVVVPTAQVRHVRAATTGRRRLGAVVTRHPEQVDRAHVLWVLLAHASWRRLPVLAVALAAAASLRASLLLITGRSGAARDELLSVLHVWRSPRLLLAGRRARARTRVAPERAMRPLLVSRRARLARGHLAGGRAPERRLTARTVLARPGVLLTIALLAVAITAERDLLGTGPLSGGRLLPAPDSAREAWSAYSASWHPTVVGSSAPAPPSLAVLAALSTLFGGKPWLAQEVALLASVPLAGASAYWAAGRVAGSALRLWAAATWALLPIATGAVAGGRVDAAVVQVALPLLAVGVGALLSSARSGVRWGLACAVGLGLAATSAFAPLIWPLAGVVLIVGGLLVGRGPSTRTVGAAVAVVVPLALHFPWVGAVRAQPGLLVHGPGLLSDPSLADPSPADPALPAWHLLMLSPGGPAGPLVAVCAGLLLAALAALLTRTRPVVVCSGWAVALLGLAAALMLVRLPIAGASGGATSAVWPGIALQVAAAGLVLAALVGADAAHQALARRSFGWRQVGAMGLVLAAGAAPLWAAGSWIAGSGPWPVSRQEGPILPAFVLAGLRDEPGARVLTVQDGGDRVHYEVSGATPSTTAGEVPPGDEQLRRLDEVVSDLLTARGSDAAHALATRGIRYVVLAPAAPAAPAALTGSTGSAGSAGSGARLVPALDAQDGLTRRNGDDRPVWDVADPAGLLTLLSPTAARSAAEGARGPHAELLRVAPPAPLTSSTEGGEFRGQRIRTAVGPDQAGRMVVLAQAADPGWEATLDGHPLIPRTAWGWAQGFELPERGGRLEIWHDRSGRHRDLTVQAALLGLITMVALGAVGRRPERPAEPR